MSADNGIYILKTPAPAIKKGDAYTNQHGKFEYRVAHTQAIENIDYCHFYIPIIFGDCVVFTSKDAAEDEAFRMEKEIINGDFPVLEYGISSIEKPFPFPNMTVETARKAVGF